MIPESRGATMKIFSLQFSTSSELVQTIPTPSSCSRSVSVVGSFVRPRHFGSATPLVPSAEGAVEVYSRVNLHILLSIYCRRVPRQSLAFRCPKSCSADSTTSPRHTATPGEARRSGLQPGGCSVNSRKIGSKTGHCWASSTATSPPEGNPCR